MSAGLHTVHLRVNDAATGQPTPVRIRVTGADGTYYAPFGRLTEFTPGLAGEDVGGNLLLNDKRWAYIDGACEINLPTDPLAVEVCKGLEYTPLRQQVTLTPGKLAVRLTMQRWSDLASDGWYSGDTWCQFITPHAALLEAAAEDLGVVNILAHAGHVIGQGGKQYRAIPNILAFSGQRPALERPGHLIVVNTLNSHQRLGRLALLNCHRVVYPLTFGGPGGWDAWTLGAWCDQCHRKGGLVVGHNFFDHRPGYHHGELLADIILGKVDALELNAGFEHPESGESVLADWHRLLNCGFRIPLVSGSCKQDNLTPLGLSRTYARLRGGEDFTYKHWIEAVRAGRSFVTNGPLLTFTANGEDPGSRLDVSGTEPVVRVRAGARSLKPFDRLEVIANGEVVASISASGSPPTASVEADVILPNGGWTAARCIGPYDVESEAWLGAQSSPVYVRVDSKTPPPDLGAMVEFGSLLEKTLEWVAREARCPTEKHRAGLAEVFTAARVELQRRIV